MPISTKYEDVDSDMVTVTPPTPEISLPETKSSLEGTNLVDEKPNVQHIEKTQGTSDERQKQIDMAAKTIRQYREK